MISGYPDFFLETSISAISGKSFRVAPLQGTTEITENSCSGETTELCTMLAYFHLSVAIFNCARRATTVSETSTKHAIYNQVQIGSKPDLSEEEQEQRESNGTCWSNI